MDAPVLKPNHIVRGAIFPEPVKILTIVPLGDAIKLIGEGLETGRVHQPILTAEQIATLEISPDKDPFDGDPARFRLGIEAMRLGLAYEYDPYFSLSIARVDPLPHQLEAVYDYFLKLPRIRFLLADDPGAGKTIMAGLLIKELKVRGLIQRVFNSRDRHVTTLFLAMVMTVLVVVFVTTTGLDVGVIVPEQEVHGAVDGSECLLAVELTRGKVVGQ